MMPTLRNASVGQLPALAVGRGFAECKRLEHCGKFSNRRLRAERRFHFAQHVEHGAAVVVVGDGERHAVLARATGRVDEADVTVPCLIWLLESPHHAHGVEGFGRDGVYSALVLLCVRRESGAFLVGRKEPTSINR